MSNKIKQSTLVFLLSSATLSVFMYFFTSELFSPKLYSPYYHIFDLFSFLGYYLPDIDTRKWEALSYTLSKSDLELGFTLKLLIQMILPIFVSALVTYKFHTSHVDTTKLKHVSGPKLRFGKYAMAHAKRLYKRDKGKGGISIHPGIRLKKAIEAFNFLIFGTTGSGKSTTLKAIIAQVIGRGENVIIYDEKSEYTALFYEQDSTVLIAPWDKRTHVWDICEDIQSVSDAQSFAETLLPESPLDKDPLWIKGARIILQTMLTELVSTRRSWGWDDLANKLACSEDEMVNLIELYDPQASQLIQKGSKTTQGFYVNIITELNWVKDLAQAWPNTSRRKFSIKRWLDGDLDAKSRIIIQGHSRFEKVGAPLCAAFITFLEKHYLAHEKLERETWLFLDEFANLPKTKSLKKWLELSRVKGARSVLCTQSPSQIRSIYGEADADTLMGLLQNVISLRIGAAGNDANLVADIFGEQEVEVPNYEHPDRIGQRMMRNVVSKTDLTNLSSTTRGVQGYLLIAEQESPYQLVWPYYKQDSSVKGVIEADWVKRTRKANVKKPSQNRLNRRGN